MTWLYVKTALLLIAVAGALGLAQDVRGEGPVRLRGCRDEFPP